MKKTKSIKKPIRDEVLKSPVVSEKNIPTFDRSSSIPSHDACKKAIKLANAILDELEEANKVCDELLKNRIL